MKERIEADNDAARAEQSWGVELTALTMRNTKLEAEAVALRQRNRQLEMDLMSKDALIVALRTKEEVEVFEMEGYRNKAERGALSTVLSLKQVPCRAMYVVASSTLIESSHRLFLCEPY